MKKTVFLLFVAILLAACQQAATPEPSLTVIEPTPGPVEALANSTSDLVGGWWIPKGGLMIEFKDDYSVRVFSGSASIGQVSSGEFSFDSGKVTFVPGGSCKDPATYEVYITKLEGNPVSIRMEVVGNDSCSDRAELLSNPGKYYTP